MLKPYANYGGIFIETTKSEHLHGGPGWEFGTCLWSPSRNKAGHDTYALMRALEPGDLVLHLYKHSWPNGVTETRLCGHSLVSASCREVTDEPPSPGTWAGMSPYYRIELQEYEPFAAPLPVSVLLYEHGEEIRHDTLEASSSGALRQLDLDGCADPFSGNERDAASHPLDKLLTYRQP